MPVALLVHVGDRRIHANPEFCVTGYASVEDLDTAGGLDVLIQRQDLEGASEEPGRVVIVRADDQLVPVTARLQSIRFERATALMLALIPAGGTTQAARSGSAPCPRRAAGCRTAGQAGAEQRPAAGRGRRTARHPGDRHRRRRHPRCRRRHPLDEPGGERPVQLRRGGNARKTLRHAVRP
jgi:hypothetical protein